MLCPNSSDWDGIYLWNNNLLSYFSSLFFITICEGVRYLTGSVNNVQGENKIAPFNLIKIESLIKQQMYL
jgi:hypothetical protein